MLNWQPSLMADCGRIDPGEPLNEYQSGGH